MNSNVNETPEKPTQRTVFFVSDATAITAETLANAVLAQFHGLKYLRYRMPFVNTEEKAKAAALRINEVGKENGVRPIVFSTLVAGSLASTFNEYCNAFVIELFRSFVGPLERELGVPSDHSVGKSHEIGDQERYNRRIDAINYTLAHDDGQTNKGLEDADVVLVGVCPAAVRLRPACTWPCSTVSKLLTIRLFQKISSAANFRPHWKTAKTRYSVFPFLPSVSLKFEANAARILSTLP